MQKKSPPSQTIKVPKQTPHMKLLGAEFVLVEHVTVPENITVMRTRWRNIQAQHSQDLFDAKTIPLKGQHKGQWQALIEITKKSKDSLKTLRNINGFFNGIASRKDEDFYGSTEYWASPQEFMTNRSGDCEDYAITKYYALQYMGWNRDDLWLVFLKDKIRGGGHAVLVAECDKGQFVLDNLSKPKHLLIPAKQYAAQVTPFAIANHHGLWLRISNDEQSKETARTR